MSSEAFVIEEVPDVVALWPELEPLVLGILDFHRPWDDRELRADWATPMREYMATHGLTLVARNTSGNAIAFLNGTVGPEVGIYEGIVGHIDNAFVLEQERSRGIGMALVERFEAWCRSRGATEIGLDVADGNVVGLGFWRRSGFKVNLHAMRKKLVMPS
jgi:GNAT superfamily N-acetyltransferase